MLCIVLVWLPLGVLFLALISSTSGSGHTAFIGVIVICLFLAGACGIFCSLGLGAMACLLLLVVLLVQLMLTRLRGCACFATVVLWGDETHLIFDCVALAPLRSQHTGLFTGGTDTMRSFFAQPDRMGFPLRH